MEYIQWQTFQYPRQLLQVKRHRSPVRIVQNLGPATWVHVLAAHVHNLCNEVIEWLEWLAVKRQFGLGRNRSFDDPVLLQVVIGLGRNN